MGESICKWIGWQRTGLLWWLRKSPKHTSSSCSSIQKTKQKQQMPEDRMGGETVREFGTDTYPPLFLKGITNKVLLCSTGNWAQCYVSAWMEGEFRGEQTHVYVWMSSIYVYVQWCTHGTVTTLLTGCNSNIKFKRLKKKTQSKNGQKI